MKKMRNEILNYRENREFIYTGGALWSPKNTFILNKTYRLRIFKELYF